MDVKGNMEEISAEHAKLKETTKKLAKIIESLSAHNKRVGPQMREWKEYVKMLTAKEKEYLNRLENYEVRRHGLFDLEFVQWFRRTKIHDIKRSRT
jgi:FtsZ-binding cell division protein ZapB